MASKQILEMSADDLHERWGTHVATIADDVLYIAKARANFHSFVKMYNRNKGLQGFGAEAAAWVSQMYWTHALMAVRRELDDQAGVINLRHLLFEIESRPDVMTRERFMDYARISKRIVCCWYHYPELEAVAKSHFESFRVVTVPKQSEWDRGERDYIDPECIAEDRRWLETETADTFKCAQLLVAHRTPKDVDLTLDVLDNSIAVILATLRKYYYLLEGEPLTPKRIRPAKTFKGAFMRPWHPDANRVDNVA